MINILLADDHVIIRSSLKTIIRTNFPDALIDEVGDGDAAFEKVKEKDYRLIVLDINMPNGDSFGLVSNIVALKPASNILMFTMNSEDVYAKRYLAIGAKGYLSKAASEHEIQKALQTTINSKRYISAALSQVFADDVLQRRSANRFDNLTPREFQIILFIIQGMSMVEICRILNLQKSTVATHKGRIFEKLGCKNIIEINDLARLNNIIPQSK